MEVSTKHIFKDEWLARALLDYEIIDSAFLDEVRMRNVESEYFIDILIAGKHLLREDIVSFIENVLQIPTIDLDDTEIDNSVVELISEASVQKYQIFPFKIEDDHISVAFANPFDLEAENELINIYGKLVKTYFSFRHQLKAKIEEYYSQENFIESLVDRVNTDSSVTIVDDKGEESKSSVVKLVSLIIGDAIKQSASDIHIEPKEKSVIVRYRIDGILHNILTIPKSVQAPLISRIKIISQLNIAESRKPQDGKAKVIHEGASIDLRISVLPTNFGEKVVIRILDSRKANVSFNQLGVRGKNLERLTECFCKTTGIILVTGPTGSGKTTTLYAALNSIRNTTNNIITIEDPIEYLVEGINQVQVNPKAGVTFPSALRSFLRQDPDVILVGEIRDQETAEIAIQAALTGHLVLSTLHTNDSLSTITRLVDMGIDIYKVASSVEAIIAQRLVRKLCPSCRKEVSLNNVDKKLISHIKQLGMTPKFYHAEGCQNCNFTGYKSRLGVFEILILNDELKQILSSQASFIEIKNAARKTGFKSLFDEALEHVVSGNTDYAEVLRVINPGNFGEDAPETSSAKNLKKDEPKALSATTRDEDKSSAPSLMDLGLNEDLKFLIEQKQIYEQQPPKMTDETEHHSVSSVSINNTKPSEAPTILLVEDSDTTRKMIKVLIEKETNWNLLEAKNGEKALELIAKGHPDVIVLDIMMPVMDGYEVLKHLRNNLQTAAIPVLLLTSLSNPQDEVKGLDLGADDFLSKPYDNNILLARIRRLLLRSNKQFLKAEPQPIHKYEKTFKLI
jgi:type IV pilus assembly protein PilB